MERLQRVAFRLDGASYRLADALLRAAVAGEWPPIEADIRRGLACEARAEVEEAPLADEDVSAAVRELRYERDLVSADEAQAWLHDWDLSSRDLRDAIARRLLRERWTVAKSDSPDDETLADAAWCDLVCSGQMETLVARLAERAAVAGHEATDDGAAIREPVLPAWLGVIETRDHPIVRRLSGLEKAYVARRAGTISADKVTAAIAAHAFEWTYLETARLVLPAETMAAEAALRVREDGESLADVAADVQRPLEAWRGFLDSADGHLKTRLAAAGAGELCGPFPDEDGHALLQVVTRRAPHPADPETRAYAEKRLWSPVAARALDRVEWEPPLARTTRG